MSYHASMENMPKLFEYELYTIRYLFPNIRWDNLKYVYIRAGRVPSLRVVCTRSILTFNRYAIPDNEFDSDCIDYTNVLKYSIYGSNRLFPSQQLSYRKHYCYADALLSVTYENQSALQTAW